MNQLGCATSSPCVYNDRHHRAYWVIDMSTNMKLGLIHVPDPLDDGTGASLTWVKSSIRHAVEIQPITCTCNVGQKASS